ncbi:transposase [bacterium]|nr:transposase [bacterium]
MRETRQYDEEFKQNAVELFLNSGKKLKQFAREIDVPSSTLKGWRNKYLEELNGKPERYSKTSSPAEMAQEIYKLKHENQTLKRQKEILKKALGILSDQAPGSMSK